MGNCSTCEMKETAFKDLSPEKITEKFISVNDRLFVHCHSGHNETLKEFFIQNDREVDLDCFKKTKTEASLDRLNQLADKILETVQK